MSLLQDDKSYDLSKINNIEAVRYDGEEMSLRDAFNEYHRPAYDIVEETGGMNTRQEISDYRTYGDDFIDEKLEEFENNQDKEFELVLDTTEGQKTFSFEDNNPDEPYAQARPRSAGFFTSETGEKVGFRLLRDYSETDVSGGLASPGTIEEGQEIQERDFLLALDRDGGVDDQLQDTSYTAIGRDNFLITEDSEGEDELSYGGSEGETAMFYNFAPRFDKNAGEAEAEQFGRYIGTLEALNLGRKDRATHEFMLSGDGRVFETDQEKFIYGGRSAGENDIVDMLTKMSGGDAAFGDPREIEQYAKEGYRDVQDEEDVSDLVPESMTEWDLDEFSDDRIL